MAKQPKKINAVITLLGEGKTSKEIIAETDCSAATITVARKRLKERENDLSEATANIVADVDENVDSFIQSVKIVPDADVLTDKKEEKVKDIDYQCPSCKNIWFAPPNERQDACPNCGMEFN